MIQFYAPDIASDSVLPESDSHHCVRVLRMQTGDPVEVIDGRGFRYECRMADPHPRHARLEIVSRTEVALPWAYRLTIGVAPTKNIDRMEWLVEKLVEIGINRFVPILCARSERREIKPERLERIAISAMKQSLKATLPIIEPMTPLDALIDESQPQQRFIAYCDRSIPRLMLAREAKPATDTLVIIGPEGDFSPDEIHLALNSGFTPVTLGDNRLRTETAALVAADTIHIINQSS